MPGVPLAQPHHWRQCMLLRDSGMGLHAIAAWLHRDDPVTFRKKPSHESVRTWVEKGREQWNAERGAGAEWDALDPAKVRTQQVRQIERMRSELLELELAGVPVTKTIPLHLAILSFERDVVGTDAPKVSHQHLHMSGAPTIPERIERQVAATVEPAALPRRRTG